MVSHPETGSDSPIGSDRDRGRDMIAQCPRALGDNISQQGSGRGRSAAPLSTRDRGRGRSGPS